MPTANLRDLVVFFVSCLIDFRALSPGGQTPSGFFMAIQDLTTVRDTDNRLLQDGKTYAIMEIVRGKSYWLHDVRYINGALYDDNNQPVPAEFEAIARQA